MGSFYSDPKYLTPNIRAAIGWVMFGWLGIAALLTLFLTPIVYLGIGRFHRPRVKSSKQLAIELGEAARLTAH